jgi:hypothetical protein
MTLIIGMTPNEIVEAASASWNTISGKPVVFPPEDHVHEVSEVSGLQTELTTIDERLDQLESSQASTSSEVQSLDNRMDTSESNIISLQNDKANLSGATFTGNVLMPNSGLVLEDNFTSLVTQIAAALDTAKTVVFGDAKTSASGLVSQAVDGVFTVLKGGPLAIKTRMRAGRVGAALTTQMFFWVETSVDNGVTWQLNGNAVDVRLENSTDSRLFFDFSTVNFPTGVKFRTRFARSSTGADFGDLIPSLPSVALQLLGVPTSPSAQITVYKYSSYNYV